ncbi:MAG: purine-nucleoside phosphorylase [Planctomycetota bacterium]
MKELTFFDRAEASAEFLRQRGFGPVVTGLTLGSGLGGALEGLREIESVRTSDIPHFPRSTVQGHSGRLVLGELAGRKVIVVQGRVHGYEGYELSDVVHYVRTLSRLGASRLILTCAAGGIREGMKPGDLCLIEDHLNLMGSSPLRGPHDEQLGERFVDLSEAYDPGLREVARSQATELGIALGVAVYAGLPGPQYETPAEVRMLRTLGAGLVGMSTVPEVIAARQVGLPVLAIALVSNAAAGLSDRPLSHEEVLEAGRQAAADLRKLLESVIGTF